MNIGSADFSAKPAPPKPRAAPAELLRLGGWVPFTTLDFPGRLAAVVFLAGCPWRCPYCHNAHLRSRAHAAGPAWSEILAELKKRRAFLEAVVFSGGEPTAQRALPSAMEAVRSLGYVVGLHTAGIFPERLRELLPLLDWVGLDIKAPPDARYDRITGRRDSATPFLRSLDVLRSSGVTFQLRTTLDSSLLSPTDQADLSAWLRQQNLPPTVWQPCRRVEGI